MCRRPEAGALNGATMFRIDKAFDWIAEGEDSDPHRALRRVWVWLVSVVLVVALAFVLCVSGARAEQPASPSTDFVVHGKRADAWRINAAGQLLLGYVVFGPGIDVWRTHTVQHVSRPQIMCGDPDGTGRHTYYIVEALIINRKPNDRPNTQRVGER